MQNTDFIPFARPSLGPEEEAAVIRVLRSGWLTTGSAALEFEKKFAAYVGARHALALNSATAGLHLALEASGVRAKSLVITTPYTFTATAETIRYLDADPLFVDIKRDSYNIDPDLVQKALHRYGKKVSAIIPVHIGGLPCDMDRLSALASDYGVPLIEDCAHAFPVMYRGKSVGRWGTVGVYSFYANKTITTGEGGMLVTEDDGIARRVKLMRLHGIDRESWNRYIAPDAGWFYSVVEAGYKYNLTDIAAAIGIEQLAKAALFLEQRKRIAERYIEGFSGLDFITLPEHSPDHAWHLFLIRINDGVLSIGRDEFIKALTEAGIGTSVHYIPLHIMPYYKSRYGFTDDIFPVALSAFQRTISLPIYPALSDEQVDRVIGTVKKIGAAHYKQSRCAAI